MPAQRFIDFALRLPAYKGVLRALIEAERYEAENESSPSSNWETPAPRGAGRDGLNRNRTVPSDAHTLLTDPALAGFIEVKGMPKDAEG